METVGTYENTTETIGVYEMGDKIPNCFSLSDPDFVLMTTNPEVEKAYVKLFRREKETVGFKTGVHSFHQPASTSILGAQFYHF